MTTSVEDRIGLEDRVSRLEGAYEHLATKADVADAKADLKSDIAELKAEHTHMATKADLADLRAELKEDMGKLQVSLIKWMVGLVLGGMVGITGLVIAVMRLLA